MKQEEKDLLLKDLCARLPYELKISVNDKVEKVDGVNVLDNTIEYGSWLSSEVEEVKPYLFPLSSMTEEQYNEMQTISGKDCMEHMEIEKEWRNNSPFTHLPLYQHRVIEFFHKYHFDYRGLIPMGLAINATGLNIY